MRFILIALLLPFSAWADDWSKTDRALQTAYTVLLAMDCAQTRYGTSHPSQFTEANRMIAGGQTQPSKGRINNVCTATGLGHFGISYVLAPGARRFWQATTIMIEVYTVANNKHIGVRMEF